MGGRVIHQVLQCSVDLTISDEMVVVQDEDHVLLEIHQSHG